jgi:septum site-determining protein MinC
MEESGNDKDSTSEISNFPTGSSATNAGSVTTGSAAGTSGGIVAARGTIDGVVIRLDGRVNKENLFAALEEFLSTRESFLGGSEVILEWIGAKPEEELTQELKTLLLDKFKISVKSSKLRESPRIDEPNMFTKQREARQAGMPEMFSRNETMKAQGSKSKSLFDGMDIVGASKNTSAGSSSVSGWDDPDARLIYSTLRSGQKVETDHSLIIFGDVNSGAEVVAGGDIVVLGTLRGVAHAGAYDETGGGRVIFALNLQPTQLRIGMVISRSATDTSQKLPEIAKVEDGIIVVEQYSVKNLSKKIV